LKRSGIDCFEGDALFSKSRLRAFTAVLLLTATSAWAKTGDLESRAKTFITDFMAGRFEKVKAQFDSTMRSEWPESKFFGVSYTIKTQYGDLKSIPRTREEKTPKYRVIVVTCRFSQNVDMDIKVVFDSKARVAELIFPTYRKQVASTNWLLSLSRSIT